MHVVRHPGALLDIIYEYSGALLDHVYEHAGTFIDVSAWCQLTVPGLLQKYTSIILC